MRTSSNNSQTERQSVRESESRTTSTSTTTRAHGAGRSQYYATEEQLDAIGEAYVQNIGPMDAKAAQIIKSYLPLMEPECILHAIEATGEAPRPSKQYLRAILRRYTMEHIITLEDVIRDEDKFIRFRESDIRRRNARWYDNTNYLTDFDVMRQGGDMGMPFDPDRFDRDGNFLDK